MDPGTQLAIMAKATHVFASDDTFLSFPLTPLLFARPKLDLLGDQSLANLIEFSGLVNLLPTGVAWQPSQTTRLWDVYRRVLTDATYAESSRTPGEEAEYRGARSILFSTDENGLRTPSERYLAYKA